MPPYQHTNPRKTSRTKSALIPLPAPVSPHVPWDEHQSTSFSSPSEMCLLLHPPRVRLLLSHSGINNELNSSSLRSAQVAHLSASISPVHPTTTRPPTRHPFRGHPVFQQAAQEGRLPIPQDLESRVSKFPVPPLRRALILRSIPFLENCCHQSYLRTRRHAKKTKKRISATKSEHRIHFSKHHYDRNDTFFSRDLTSQQTTTTGVVHTLRYM